MKYVVFSRFNRPKTIFAPSSDGFAPIYEERINRNGIKVLVEVGRHNLNEFVQSSLEGTLVYNILHKFELGDTSVLEKVKGFYADVTEVPTSLIEVHNLMSRVSKNFDSLPSELKEKFGNSPETFLASIENGEFSKIIASMQDSKKQDSKVDPDNGKDGEGVA